MWICAGALSGCSSSLILLMCQGGGIGVYVLAQSGTLTSGLHVLPSQQVWRARPAHLCGSMSLKTTKDESV